MGALLETAKPAELHEGMRFAQIEVNMGQWGVFHFDAQLISISERKVIDGKNETITTPRLSFRFLNVSPTVERQLQRIIFSLEREARKKRTMCATDLHRVQCLLKFVDIARSLRRRMISRYVIEELISIQIVDFADRLFRSDEKVRSSAPAPLAYDTTSAYCSTFGSSMPASGPVSRIFR